MLMKKCNISLFIVLCVVISALLIPSNMVLAKPVGINKTKTTTSVGSSFFLKMSTKQNISWSSSNNRIASVNSFGKVTAKKIGTTKIRAKTKNRTYSCIVTVDNPRMDKNKAELSIGASVDLNFTGTKRPIEWESKNETVAIVKDGEVTALSEGTTEIIGSVGRDAECICKITVRGKKPVAIEAIYFKEDVIVLDTQGQTKRLLLEILPYEAIESQNIIYSSSNPGIVSVNQSGTVTAISDGSVTITASANNGVVSSCIVNSYLTKEITMVVLDKTELIFSGIQEEYKLNAIITPNDAKDTSLEWKSSNETIATVDNLGIVRSLSSGNCIITVTTLNGRTASCFVKVELQSNEIYFCKQNINLNKIGDTEKIRYYFKLNMKEEYILWSSDDPQIVKIDEIGMLQAVGEGTTVIRATLKNGSSRFCIVTVKKQI